MVKFEGRALACSRGLALVSTPDREVLSHSRPGQGLVYLRHRAARSGGGYCHPWRLSRERPPGPTQLLRPEAGRVVGLWSCVGTSLGASRRLRRVRACPMNDTAAQRLCGAAGVGNGACAVCKRRVISGNAMRSWAVAFRSARRTFSGSLINKVIM